MYRMKNYEIIDFYIGKIMCNVKRKKSKSNNIFIK